MRLLAGAGRRLRPDRAGAGRDPRAAPVRPRRPAGRGDRDRRGDDPAAGFLGGDRARRPAGPPSGTRAAVGRRCGPVGPVAPRPGLHGDDAFRGRTNAERSRRRDVPAPRRAGSTASRLSPGGPCRGRCDRLRRPDRRRGQRRTALDPPGNAALQRSGAEQPAEGDAREGQRGGVPGRLRDPAQRPLRRTGTQRHTQAGQGNHPRHLVVGGDPVRRAPRDRRVEQRAGPSGRGRAGGRRADSASVVRRLPQPIRGTPWRHRAPLDPGLAPGPGPVRPRGRRRAGRTVSDPRARARHGPASAPRPTAPPGGAACGTPRPGSRSGGSGAGDLRSEHRGQDRRPEDGRAGDLDGPGGDPRAGPSPAPVAVPAATSGHRRSPVDPGQPVDVLGSRSRRRVVSP